MYVKTVIIDIFCSENGSMNDGQTNLLSTIM